MNLKSTLSNIFGAFIEKSDSNYAPDDLALIFSTIESHSLNIQANITDYWLEDQTAVQDCIGLQPLQMTLSGLVGDIEYNNTSQWTNNILGKINNLSKEKLGFNLTNKLGIITSLLPEVDNYTQTAKNAIKQIEDVYNNIKGKINNFLGNKTQTNQQKQVEWLIKAWQSKIALKVTTPFGVFDSMYLLSVPVVQENTNTVTKISVTLKQLRFANEPELILNNTNTSPIMEEINNICQSPTIDNGMQKTTDLDLKSYISNFTGGNSLEGLSL